MTLGGNVGIDIASSSEATAHTHSRTERQARKAKANPTTAQQGKPRADTAGCIGIYKICGVKSQNMQQMALFRSIKRSSFNTLKKV